MQPSLFPEIVPTDQEPSGPASAGVDRRALNAAQFEAVSCLNGPVLVIAGAGSGKTRTLVYRVAYLLEQGIAPDNILLLTFTRRAAQEMLWRACRLHNESCRQVTGGTFHAIANLLLRRYGRHIGYSSDFTILDRSDAEGIVNILKSSLALSGAGKRFPSNRVIIGIISGAVNKALPLADLVLEQYSHLAEFLDDIIRLQEHYAVFKRDHGLMDYDDLLVNWEGLLTGVPEIREEISRRFAYIMVDEYQDTNHIQARIVRQLAHTHDNVMVVGDDSQSIYSFRGANFRNIMDFPKVFPGTRIIKLEENYRSAQPILTLANGIIAQAAEKFTKTLFTRIEGAAKPALFGGRDESEEARFVVEKILARRAAGTPLREMAVLFRSGFHSYKLEMELASRHIPFEKRGGLKLTESAHIKDMLSYFRVLVNPRDMLSWHRILLLLDKIGPKTAQKIVAAVKAAAEPLAVLQAYPAGERFQKGLAALAAALASVKAPELSPAARFDLLLDYYLPVFERIYYDDYPKRRKDLEQLRVIISGYDDLQTFVADAALDPPEAAAEAGPDGADSDRLILSTVHSAKGLEWDTVFIISLAEGKFPHGNTLPGEQYEEERRLLYVAVTRAKHHLFFSYPRQVMSPDRRFYPAAISPFLAEITTGLFETVQAGGDSGYGERLPAGAPSRPGGGRPLKTALDITALPKGTMVKHPFFGRGKIKAVIGPRTVEVEFPGHGSKNLHLDYAKLELLAP